MSLASLLLEGTAGSSLLLENGNNLALEGGGHLLIEGGSIQGHLLLEGGGFMLLDPLLSAVAEFLYFARRRLRR